MPIKCESCRHFLLTSDELFVHGRCYQPDIVVANHDERFGRVSIMTARKICDREGDGHFVYFEPNTPTAGAAFASGTSTSSPPSTSTPTTPELAMKAAA